MNAAQQSEPAGDPPPIKPPPLRKDPPTPGWKPEREPPNPGRPEPPPRQPPPPDDVPVEDPTARPNRPSARLISVRRAGDLRQAMLDPASVFDTPYAAVHDTQLQRFQKIQLSRRWEYDASQVSVAQQEG